MNQIQCPHCRNVLIDDGQLAGHVVACPQCQGQFQMPGHTKPPMVATGPQISTSPSSATYRTAGRRPRRRKDLGALVVVCLAGLAVLITGVGFVLLQRSKTSSTEVSGSNNTSNQPVVTPVVPTALEEDVAEAAKVAAEVDRRRREEEARLEEEKRALEEQQRLQREYQSRRQTILQQLENLASQEQREVETLLESIRVYRARVIELEPYVAQLKSKVTELQVDRSIGSMFGGRTLPGRAEYENMIAQKYRAYAAELIRTESLLEQAEQRLKTLHPEYERERNRLLAELAELGG